MMKSLLKGRSRDQAKSKRGAETDPVFSITRVRFPDRSVIAFEKCGGQAAVLEITETGAEVLRGLAAGAAVSDIQEVEKAQGDGTQAALMRDQAASREEAVAFIQSLDLIGSIEKQELLGALPR